MSDGSPTDGSGAPRVGIAGAAASVPRARIGADAVREAWGRFQASGVQSKAVAGADEDSLTMAAEAARRALDAAGVDAERVSCLTFGTSTPPLEEEDPTPRLGAFLGVPSGASRRYLSGSTRAGTSALAAALDRANGVGNERVPDTLPALVVAADRPRGEPSSPEDHAAGAGAAALVLTADGPATVGDRAEYAVDYPGTRFREAGSERVEGLGVSAYDRRAFVETVRGAVSNLGTDLAHADALALQAPDGKLPYRAAAALGADADLVSEVTPVHDLGDLGAASPLFALVRALDAGRERVVVVGYGSGAGADAFEVVVDPDGGAPPTDRAGDSGEDVSYAEYLRLRGEITDGPPAGGGAAVSVPSWRRSREARYRLVAGACPDCSALAFPPEGACPDCGSLAEFEPVELPKQGVVEAVTTVSPGGAPPEFVPQAERGGAFGVAIVAFEREADGEGGAGSASVPLQATDCDPAELDAGDEVEAVVRRIYTQEGVTRYGRKVRPVE
ncbi:zinc ribbon domain-containing protein [Halobium salinum]|uniref:Zinc ribbon domain-containing protein n=1 Tax=Halobium salinum TaxID=1364940 RepID=A0ABD5PE26_9EURY|nr:zinc ribbon domain-containing protein [Halobium salinum]